MHTRERTGSHGSGRGRTPRRLLCGWLVGALLVPQAAWANPTGAQVANGTVSIQQSGATTTIHASDGSIINYQSFSVAPQETVQFVQPGAQARVLNRVTGVDPSQIDGRLLANGQVYLVNPAGVFFGRDAVVDVGRMVAVAGSVRDEDFLAGADRFDLSGRVENRGQITAADGVALAGTSVANEGNVVAREGSIVMVAGDKAYLTEHGSHVLVQVSGPTAGGDGAAVANDGRLEAPAGPVRLASGDAMGLAVRAAGEIRSRDVALDGGAGDVEVTGRIDATGAPGEVGGRVEVRGEGVVVDGATIDASGDAGGGTILVGGDVHGGGDGRNASATLVTESSQLRADAREKGDGGKVVVWADGATSVRGAISARGGAEGGDGGFVETSGKRFLDPGTTPDLSAPAGAGGTWLLDPANITVVTGTGTLDAIPLSFNELRVFSPVGTSSIGADRIVQALEGGTNVLISTFINPFQSDPALGAGLAGDITIGAPIEVTWDPTLGALAPSLQMLAAGSIYVNNPIRVKNPVPSTQMMLNVSLLADDPSQTGQGGGDGVGDVVVSAPIVTNGGTFVSRGVDFTMTADLDPKNKTQIDVGQADLQIVHTGNVTIDRDITAGNGEIRAGSDGSGNLLLGTNQSVVLKGGLVHLFAGDDVGGAKLSTVTLGRDTNRVTVDLMPIDVDGDGTNDPTAFELSQDADLSTSALDHVDFVTAPDETMLIATDGALSIDDASRAPATQRMYLEGDSIGIQDTLTVPDLELVSHGKLTIGTGMGEVDPAKLVASDLLALSAGSSGTGDLTIGPVTLGPVKTLELRAGDGRAGAGTDAAVLLDPATVLDVSDTLSIRQDEAFAADSLPDVRKAGGSFAMQELEFRSDDGKIALSEADLAKVGAQRTSGAFGPDDVDVVFTTSDGLDLPDVAGDWIDFGNDSFTWQSPQQLVVTTELNPVRADRIVLHGGLETNTLGLGFAPPVVDPIDPATFVRINAREVQLSAGDGPGGVEGGSVEAGPFEYVDRGSNMKAQVASTLFFGRDGSAGSAPETLVFEQDAPIKSSAVVKFFPGSAQFGNATGPTGTLVVRTNDTSLRDQVASNSVPLEDQNDKGLVVDDFTPFDIAPRLVLSGPSVSFEPAAGTTLDFGSRARSTEVRADFLRFLAFDDSNGNPGRIQANNGLSIAGFDSSFSFTSLAALPPTSPTRVHLGQDGGVSTDQLPTASRFGNGIAGIAYSLASRAGGDVNLAPDPLRVAGTKLTLSTALDASGAHAGSIHLANASLESLQVNAAGDLLIGTLAGGPVQITATDSILLHSGIFQYGPGQGDLSFAPGSSLSATNKITMLAGVGASTEAQVDVRTGSPTLTADEITIAQDAPFIDTLNAPAASQYGGPVTTLTLGSFGGSATITDPGLYQNVASLVVSASSVIFDRTQAASNPTASWDFDTDFGTPDHLTVAGLFTDTSPGSLSIVQQGDLSGSSLLLPDTQLPSGLAGVAYQLESKQGDVVIDDAAVDRNAGSRLSLSAPNGGVHFDFDPSKTLSLASLSVGDAATLVQDTRIQAGTASFASTLDGAHAFTLAGYTSAAFNGDVGAQTALASFTLGDSANGTALFPGATRVVTQGDITLGGRSTVPAFATLGKTSGDLRLQSNAGRVLMGANEKLSVVGRLEISAPGTVQLGDVNALALAVTSPDIRIARRAPGQVQTAGGSLLRDAGVDILANSLDFSSTPVATGFGSDPVIGVADARQVPASLVGFPLALIHADGSPLVAGDLSSGGALLDRRSEGPSFTNPAEIYAGYHPAVPAAAPNPVVLASLATAGMVGIEPRQPDPAELLAMVEGVVVYDDVARGRGYALLHQAVKDVARPPREWRDAETGEGSGAEEHQPMPVAPVPVTSPRLEPGQVDRTAELYQQVFGANDENAPRIRATLQRVIEDYRRDTGARAVHGFELRRYIRNRPSSQFEAYRTLKQLDELFRVQRRSGLAPGEYERIEDGWLGEIRPDGIAVEELREAIHPSGKRRSGDILEIFGR